MGNLISQEKIVEALRWAYDKAVNSSVPGMDSAEEMASEYLKQNGTLAEKVNSLIRWQNTKAGAIGFAAGFGGGITALAAIPANLASVLYLQIRMIAAIAKMGGHDLRNDKVRTLVIVCLAGNSAVEILRDAGIQVGKKVAEIAVGKISGEVIKQINRSVGFRLLAKNGTAGAINLGKMVPFVGGVVGGALDFATTNAIGNIACKIFIEKRLVDVSRDDIDNVNDDGASNK